MYVTVEDIKRHINVDFSDDDTLIASYIEAAEASVEKAINTPLEEWEVNGVLPAPLIHAIRITTAKLYEYREGTVHSKVSEVPFTLGFLITPYVTLK